MSSVKEFKPGELFVYVNGTKWELGTVKRKVNADTYACWYSTGDTAARTPVEFMHKLANAGYTHIEGKLETIARELLGFWPNLE